MFDMRLEGRYQDVAIELREQGNGLIELDGLTLHKWNFGGTHPRRLWRHH